MGPGPRRMGLIIGRGVWVLLEAGLILEIVTLDEQVLQHGLGSQGQAFNSLVTVTGPLVLQVGTGMPQDAMHGIDPQPGVLLDGPVVEIDEVIDRRDLLLAAGEEIDILVAVLLPLRVARDRTRDWHPPIQPALF